MNEKLLPCPFCGAPGVYMGPEWYVDKHHAVECDGLIGSDPATFVYCGAEVNGESEEEVRAMWNRRVVK